MNEQGKVQYLYGAAVQGIQNFILQTNELKEIIGASGLVERICTSEFEEFYISKQGRTGELIVGAAGNIKCLFFTREACEKAVLEFPRKVMELAPGITISQAIVSYPQTKKSEDKFSIDGENFQQAVEELERRLKNQRNKPMPSLTLGLIGILRSRKTGLPVVQIHKEKDGTEEFWDEATRSKKREKEKPKALCKICFGDDIDDSKVVSKFNELNPKNDWIAVIHADGNGLGQIIQAIGKNKDKLKEFSVTLDKATKEAAQKAYQELQQKDSFEDLIPIRPIVLGGDDFTVVCRADIAIDYIQSFIKAFEEKTHFMMKHILTEAGLDKLAMCAGIAFIKSSYPFYYGYKLSEKLCGYAKKDAKNRMEKGLAPSCLMFHKVQDSFVEEYEDIKRRELTTPENVSLVYGPYYLHKRKDGKKQ